MRLKGINIRSALGIGLVLLAMPSGGRAYGQSPEQIHILQPGETNLDVELFYNLPKPDLDALNSDQNLSLAEAGSQIIVGYVAKVQPVVTEQATPIASPLPNADPPGIYTVQRGDTLFRIATQYGLPLWALAAANDITDPDTIYVGQQLNLAFNPADYHPPTPAPTAKPTAAPAPVKSPQVSTASGKQIVIVLSEQMTYAYEDGQMVGQFVVSTGLPATPTVLGNYAIYLKYDSQRMTGPDYDLPGVPWVMYFYRGYGLHGTYWHNNFGHPMSHGCVNMRTGEAEWLYQWAHHWDAC